MKRELSAPELKIRMIQRSLHCFVYGWLGFLPVVGLAFAIAALCNGGGARVYEKRAWNAAKPYRTWGMILAAVSLIGWSGALMLFFYYLITERSMFDN